MEWYHEDLCLEGLFFFFETTSIQHIRRHYGPRQRTLFMQSTRQIGVNNHRCTPFQIAKSMEANFVTLVRHQMKQDARYRNVQSLNRRIDVQEPNTC